MTEPQEPGTEQPTSTTPTTTAPEVPPEVAQQEFAYSDHRLYANALYAQPVWVVDAVFSPPTGLDQNAKHTPANVQAAINQMMQQPDKSFEVEVPQ